MTNRPDDPYDEAQSWARERHRRLQSMAKARELQLWGDGEWLRDVELVVDLMAGRIVPAGVVPPCDAYTIGWGHGPEDIAEVELRDGVFVVV
jgi:hypothetical protein